MGYKAFGKVLTMILFILIFVRTASASVPTTRFSDYIKQGKSEPPRMVAAQVLLFHSKTFAGLRQEITTLKNAGFNTIIVRVFQNTGDRSYPISGKRYAKPGVYFKTDKAPVVYDLLSDVLKISKPLGLKVFAWMTTRYSDWEYSKANATYKYDFRRKKFVVTKGLNLFSVETKNYLTGLYSDLAKYDIDGILFQDDLVLRHNEGFSPAAQRKFRKIYGYIPKPALFYKSVYYSFADHKYYVHHYTKKYRQFARFKNHQILTLAAAIMKRVRDRRPNIKFALNCYYEAGLKPEDALLWLAQDLTTAKKYPFDYFSMMSYQNQIKRELNLTEAQSVEAVMTLSRNMMREIGSSSKVIMKIQTIDWQTGRMLSPVSVNSLISDIKGIADFSIALVPYRDNRTFYKMTKQIRE